MKSIKEIRKEANFIYSKSSHYIGGLFMVVGSITGIITGLLTVFSNYFNIPFLPVLAILLVVPFEYGLIKAALLSYERKAKEVKTKEFTLLGIKNINKSFVPFVGKKLILFVASLLAIALALVLSASLKDFGKVALSLVTGQLDYVYGAKKLLVSGAAIFGLLFGFIVSIALECYFILSYYLVVDKDEGLFASLSHSIKYMRGDVWKFIKLRLSFLPYIFINAMVLGVVNYFLSDTVYGWFQLVNMSPVILDCIVAILYGIASSVITVMIYEVKERLAFVVFYKEVIKETIE